MKKTFTVMMMMALTLAIFADEQTERLKRVEEVFGMKEVVELDKNPMTLSLVTKYWQDNDTQEVVEESAYIGSLYSDHIKLDSDVFVISSVYLGVQTRTGMDMLVLMAPDNKTFILTDLSSTEKGRYIINSLNVRFLFEIINPHRDYYIKMFVQ